MRLCSYCATLQGVEETGWSQIGDEIRGILLGSRVLGAGEAALQAIAGREREACLDAWRGLEHLSPAEREPILAQWRARAATGLPSGIEALHPSWTDFALAEAPAALRAGSPPPAIAAIAFAPLAPLCPDGRADCGPLATRLCALGFEALETEVTRVGARTLAHALAGADVAARARRLGEVGEPWASLMIEAFSEPVSATERKAALLLAASNLQPSARTPAERLRDIGLAALTAQLEAEHPGSRFRVAGRLPAELGRRLLGW